jgi:hypothetical protein
MTALHERHRQHARPDGNPANRLVTEHAQKPDMKGAGQIRLHGRTRGELSGKLPEFEIEPRPNDRSPHRQNGTLHKAERASQRRDRAEACGKTPKDIIDA